jgi:hypothetical protein
VGDLRQKEESYWARVSSVQHSVEFGVGHVTHDSGRDVYCNTASKGVGSNVRLRKEIKRNYLLH